MRTTLPAHGVVLWLTLLASRAHADGTSVALELFAQGKELMNAGDCTSARLRFMESARLDARVGTVASLAVCEEQLGHLVEAQARWLQARTLAIATNDVRRPIAERELARVDGVVPRLRIGLRGPRPAGLVIKADDVEVTPSMLDTALAVDAGTHAIRATAPGKRPWSTEVRTSADGKVTDLVVGPLEGEGPVEARRVDVDSAQRAPTAEPMPVTRLDGVADSTPRRFASVPASSGWREQRTFGVLLTGTGVAILAVGGTFGLRTIALKGERNGLCDARNACDPQGIHLDRDARSAATVSNIAMAVGAAVAAGGIVIVVTAPHAARSGFVGVIAQPGGAELQWTGSW
ncbi:MAG TPA: hypothetical protein VGY54_04945 [Polyangiaceae bacterium]|nr:hypothetical protein [Polyangiaceae bacterium]